jgi:hypothetical protein
MSTDYVPVKENDFHHWQRQSLDYAALNAPRFRIDPQVFTDMAGKRGNYELKYDVSENPDTRTSAHILARQEARKVLETAIRSFFKEYIIYNSSVTDEDRRIMGLTIPDPKPTPVPKPEHAPEVTVTVVDPATLNVAFRDKNEKGHAKAYGIHGAETLWGVFDAGAPAPVGPPELPHSSFATHSPLRLAFDWSDRGKTLYFVVRWENNNAEKGPWSEMQKTIIP